jgi:uncharacterized protein YdeI (YjbR/CyaY-like superfamily)
MKSAIIRLSGGVIHDVSDDLREAILASEDACTTWEDITPLARNEWICWIESARKSDTRLRRIAWAIGSLSQGKRRPCCWEGCSHRG